MPRFRLPPFACALAGALGVLFTGAQALAFERQWHFGAGGGVASPGSGMKLGPALGLHGAYGLSDVFDARLEVMLSQHAAVDPALAPNQLFGAKLGIAYKLDIIQWIPYFGVSAGFLGAAEARAPYRRAQATLGLLGGLDYAIGRNVGVGVIGSVDYALGPPATLAAGLLRVEYRFGW